MSDDAIRISRKKLHNYINPWRYQISAPEHLRAKWISKDIDNLISYSVESVSEEALLRGLSDALRKDGRCPTCGGDIDSSGMAHRDTHERE